MLLVAANLKLTGTVLFEFSDLRWGSSDWLQGLENFFALVLLVFSVTPFKIYQNKKSKPFYRISLESGFRKKVDMQRLSSRFRSQQFFLWKICGETFYPNL